MVRYNELKGLYEVEKTIGCGGFAKVKLATHLATGEKVAIKIMSKAVLGNDMPRVKLEIKALKTLSHENICKLYQVIESEEYFFIIIEYCSGGELFDHIVEKNRLTESESRMFFRQIVSAVAYLHSLGYAHRDLKPENILLDKNQDLKLIDFGLCAKPEGGIESLLKTSCGSPTYAAPELVLGQQYFGPEVDVWAMGVLLYALLAGFLPFDDVNIDSLYKKILSGKFDYPRYISSESRKLISAMLQKDPKRRITVKELLSHHWVTMQIWEPVSYRTLNFRQFDGDCVNVMAAQYHSHPDDMWKHLKRWKYDYHTATYILLLSKKKRGTSLKLYPVSVHIPLQHKANATPKKMSTLKIINHDSNSPYIDKGAHTPDMDKKTPSGNKSTPVVYLTPVNQKHNDENVSGEFLQPTRPSSIRKAQKRIRSPTLDDSSPVPAKKRTPGRSTPRTPDGKRTASCSDTPGSARRMLGSIERSLHKVRHVLTPRKTNSDQPVLLTSKELCNVSTTQCTDAEYVINELQKGLEKKGIHCERKGFSLRGKMEPNADHRFGGCSFELEICHLPNLGRASKVQAGLTPTKSILKHGIGNCNTPTSTDNAPTTPTGDNGTHRRDNAVIHSSSACVGIRRKRLKGDAWCYKKVCEQVLALTATDLKQVTESTV